MPNDQPKSKGKPKSPTQTPQPIEGTSPMIDHTALASEVQSITIQGIVFHTPRVYATGHVMTEHEAAALDQTRAENLRNNFAGRIKAKLDELVKTNPEAKVSDLSEHELKAEFHGYASSYAFAARQARAPVDPVEAEAYKIAKAQITSALRERNIDLKTISPEKMAEYVTAMLAKYPTIREEAKRRVETTKAIGASVLEALGA